MSLRKRALGTIAVLFLLAIPGLPLVAQDAKGGLSGGLGTEVINGETFQTLSLLPDIAIGPFGVGVDLSFHFRFYDTPNTDFGFYPRVEDWWDTSATLVQNLNKWTSRLAYFRYGTKGAPLYIQAGELPAVTLGNGFIVGSYSNGMLRPEQKFTGIIASADGKLFDFPYVGIESFVDNISGFDLMGFRAYFKPFALLMPDNAFLKEMQVGFTETIDDHPYVYTSTPDTSGFVNISGFDASLPLLGGPLFSAKAYADYALQGLHSGGTIGLGGAAFSVVSWGLAARFLGDDFLPAYFDKGYDLNRDAKYAIYTDNASGASAAAQGAIGWQLSMGGNFFDKVVFGASLGGPLTAATGVNGKPSLQSFLTVQDIDILPLTVDAYYNKDDLTSLDELFSPLNAVIGARIGYNIGNTTITMVYSLHYLATPGPDGKQWETTSRLETAVKLF